MNRSKTWTQSTTSAGEFRFENLPPGVYGLSARLDPYVPGANAMGVKVPEAGCAQVFPVLQAQAAISGQLRNELGKPASGETVELLRKNQAGGWYSMPEFRKQTDRNGEFSFENLPAGEYLLGYEIRGDKPSHHSRYPTVYYPGVPGRQSATILRLAPKQSIEDLNFSLSPPHTPRPIHVQVVWPDGKVPDRNLLQLTAGKELIANVGGSLRGEQPSSTMEPSTLQATPSAATT
jgi:hypothetical protein